MTTNNMAMISFFIQSSFMLIDGLFDQKKYPRKHHVFEGIFLKILINYFFLRFKPASPAKPVPSRNMVAGSGTGAVFTVARTIMSW